MPFPNFGFILSTTAIVISNDAPSPVKWAARAAKWALLGAGGRIQICNGANDDVEIQAAIDALPASGGRVVLSGGTFSTALAIDIDKNNTILQGQGYSTVIDVADTITNSINCTANYCTLEDFKLNGNGKATQFLFNGAYNNLYRVYSNGHATYNMYISSGGAKTIANCVFYSGVVKSKANAITYFKNYFNGNSVHKCLIVDGADIFILGNTFETYNIYAIEAANNATSRGINIEANYFETTYEVTATILFGGPPYGCYNPKVTGNYVRGDANTTTDLSIGYGVDTLVKANDFRNGITVGSAVAGEADISAFTDNISYNTLTLRNLILRNGLPIFESDAAPAAGTWPKGSEYRRPTPSAGESTGGRCTTAGTPGTWTAELDSHAADLDAHTYNKYEKLVPGQYMVSYGMGSPAGTFAITADILYAMPFVAVRPMTVDRIAMAVTSAGALGTGARLGIYQSDANGEPSSLLLDAGIVAVDSVGVRAITINQSLTKGLYWLVCVSDGTPTVRRHYACATPYGIHSGWSGLVSRVYKSHTYGALPDPFGTASTHTGESVYVSLRLASLD